MCCWKSRRPGCAKTGTSYKSSRLLHTFWASPETLPRPAGITGGMLRMRQKATKNRRRMVGEVTKIPQDKHE